MHPNHRQANKKVLGHILKEVMESNSRVYRGKEIERDISARFKIQITYAQAWRAKCYALQLLRGSPEESFTQLPIYCHNLKKSNPGTITEIETDDLGRFELLFVAIGCAIRTFCNHLRPLIIIDGAHLKGRYLGTMFLAVAMDGNNQIVPIAYGVGKTESGDSWTWFLTKLKDCIGEVDNLVIISDRANSIDLAIRRVFRNAFHGICCRHLCMNLRVKSKKSNEIEWLFWKAVKSYQVSEFEYYMNGIRSVNPRIGVKLQDAGYERWSRAHSPSMRYNVMTSNSAESVNALSRYARKLPIIMLIDFFRSTLQQWYFTRRHTGVNLQQTLTPWAEAKIDKRIKKSSGWTVRPIADYRFEVLDRKKNGVVDLRDKTCTCRVWQLSGLPCGHLIAVLRHYNQNDCSEWAIDYYKADVYRACYAELVNPVGHPSEWEIPDQVITVKPPLMEKRQAGRPCNRDRIPSLGEDRIMRTCTRCGRTGHTRRDCPSPLPCSSIACEYDSVDLNQPM